jgi:subtilisin family serine protease
MKTLCAALNLTIALCTLGGLTFSTANAASPAPAELVTEAIVTPLESTPAAFASVRAVSKHALVQNSEPVFGTAEKESLKSLGDQSSAEALKISVQSSADLVRLKAWALKNHPRVLIESNASATTQDTQTNQPTEPLNRYQWGFLNQGEPQGTALDDITTLNIPGTPGEDIGLFRAPQELRVRTSPIRVAILDTGIDLKHPDLMPHIVRNTSECEALDVLEACLKQARNNETKKQECRKTLGGIDTDKNGYPLDCHGWNLTGLGARVVPGQTLGDPYPQDDRGHGSHVAGLVGALANGSGTRGVIENVALIPIRVIESNPNPPIEIRTQDTTTDPPSPTEGPQGLPPARAFADTIARGILYAIRADAQVINMSLAWPLAADSLLMRKMVRLAQDRKIIVVSSAGNDSNEAQVMPCSYSGVICVAAHGPDGALSHFSNSGPQVDIAAPGLKILSTWVIDPLDPRRAQKLFTEVKGYEYRNGTSMAAPILAGVVARLLNDGISSEEVYPRLLLSARPVRSSSFRNSSLAPKWIRSGNVDLPQAFSVSPQPLILPADKSIVRVQWDQKSNSVPLSFTVKNFWKEAPASRLKLKVLNTTPASRFAAIADAEVQLPVLKTMETATITTSLKILSPAVEGRLTLEITDERGRSSRIALEISLPVDKNFSVPGAQTFLFSGAPVTPGATLRSINSLVTGGAQEYLALQRSASTEPGSWGVQLIREGSPTYTVSPSIPFDPIEGEIYLASRLEIEGKSQYLVVSRVDIKAPAPIPSTSPSPGTTTAPSPSTGVAGSASAVKGWKFAFFDSQLKPLRDFKYDNKITGLPDRFRWMSIQDSSGQRQLTPAWISVGTTPESEQPNRSNDPWGLIPEDSFQTRFYYIDLDGKLRSVAPPQDYALIDTLVSTEDQKRRGEVSVVLSKGTGYRVDYFRATVSNQKLGNLEPLSFTRFRNLRAAPMISEVLNLDASNESGGTAYSGSSDGGAFRTTLFPTTSTQVRWDSKLQPMNVTESVSEVVSTFSGAQRAAAFTLTAFELQYHDFKLGKTANSSLNKFSFIPRFIAIRKFFPVVIASSQERLPAVFIPLGLGDTPANEVITPEYSPQGDLLGLSRPARMRLEDTSGPQGCSSLGRPRPADSQGVSQIVFFCGDRFIRVPLN